MSTATPVLHSPHHHVLTNLKRKAGPDEQTSTSNIGSGGRKTLVEEVQVVAASTNTPIRSGSAQRAKESASNSRSVSKSASGCKQTNSTPAAAPVSTQLEMGKYLEDELRGAIYCDPNFEQNFLKVGKDREPLLDEAIKACSGSFANQLRENLSGERALYRPIAKVLNRIKGAVERVRGKNHLGLLGQAIQDHHKSGFFSEDPEMSRIKPDLVMFEGTQETWETLMMPIEVKAKHTFLKVGMKQLARYARGIFAHQIHRRFVYGMVICRWAATFVRFDRSGILHSKPIDMKMQPDKFRRAFAGLMMLDRDGFGYDTAFSTELTAGGRMEYYVDLPAKAIPVTRSKPETGMTPELDDNNSNTGANETSSTQNLVTQHLTRRFKVMQRLCHRKCIRGRATIVLRLREVQKQSQQQGNGRRGAERSKKKSKKVPWEEIPGARDYILKIIWRNPNKRPEGEVLKRDKLKHGAACHKHSDTLCGECHDITPAQPVEQAVNLGDLDISVPEDMGEKEPEYDGVDTSQYTGKLFTHRTARIHSWMLVESVGRLLWTAESTRELLEAILDGILGYWHAVNQGILHRDISDGNVLIRESGGGLQPLNREGQKGAQNSDSRFCPLPSTEPDSPSSPERCITQDNHPLAESRKALRLILDEIRLSRDMRGFIGDYDLFTTHGKMGPEFFNESSKREWTDESNSGALDAEGSIEKGPSSKRHKLNNDDIQSKSSGNSQECEEISGSRTTQSRAYKTIDFRTGTPTFMSVRVLRVPIGAPYAHDFLDDLESFFWLLLWCVIEHRDIIPSKNGAAADPTPKASELLQLLDRHDSDFAAIAGSKSMILIDCSRGEFEADLKACENTWATDPIIIDVIQQLGAYFHDIPRHRDLSKYKPEKVFPKIVDIFRDTTKRIVSTYMYTASHD
ncbi:hypothetical protein RSOLAG1IB_05398 [Rhizoctonia solani AG-1 IB]|uniref:Fungal-type protein kinase domain-containing protein n=1 Tax=Thanatephorus cucumeris (strain AG1-IB / isolate 7/3/14) TaxID=1108050 RepID=A0A0B7G2L3_THACB|nr:hypothetical protein RSOLAG1IB_05398 [Rhizoctonia solani AG-1 IB]